MIALLLVCLAFLVPATVASGYYFVLATIGWRQRTTSISVPHHRFTVLIPAHNEEKTIGDAIHSVFASDYPQELLRVLVVADNCADRTAKTVQALGAECVERFSTVDRGKGYALAFGMPIALANGTDAVFVMDADCELSPNSLRIVDATLTRGAAVVQAAVIARNPDVQPTGFVAATGAQIENAVAAGLDRLGFPVTLRGTGMVLSRKILERFPWTAFGITEDAEYSSQLREAGVRVHFVLDAEVRSEAPPTSAALTLQRRRWRAALFTGGLSWFHRWLASKPLVLLHLVLTVAVVAVSSAGLPTEVAVAGGGWLGVLFGVTAVVYLRAIRRGGLFVGGITGVAHATFVVTRLACVTLAGIVQRGTIWERTPRVADVARSGA